MALDRSRLREELVAVISAGRELAPEYDYLLADAFLDASYRSSPGPRSRFLELFDNSERMRNLIGVACLALAAFAFSVLLFQGSNSGATFGRPSPAFFPGMHDPDGFGGHGLRWHDHEGYQDTQAPWFSTSP